jgi:hypothetical protein
MPTRRKHIPKETLQHLYLEKGLSPRAIGLQLGCGETAVRKRLKEYNIPMRSRSQAIRLGKGIVIERKTLIKLYWDQSLSIPEAEIHWKRPTSSASAWAISPCTAQSFPSRCS